MARDDDEDRPRPVPTVGPGARNLAPLSIDELNAYIRELEQEILRVRHDIAAKQQHRSGAESIFRR
jgi:uncharacterized small protein (DUF1192 family)